MPRGQAMFLKSFVHWNSMGVRDKSLPRPQTIKTSAPLRAAAFHAVSSLQAAPSLPPYQSIPPLPGECPQPAPRNGLCSAPHIQPVCSLIIWDATATATAADT